MRGDGGAFVLAGLEAAPVGPFSTSTIIPPLLLLLHAQSEPSPGRADASCCSKVASSLLASSPSRHGPIVKLNLQANAIGEAAL